MTSRNLTEVFVIMRNNAQHNRNMYDDDRVSQKVNSFFCVHQKIIISMVRRVVTVKSS